MSIQGLVSKSPFTRKQIAIELLQKSKDLKKQSVKQVKDLKIQAKAVLAEAEEDIWTLTNPGKPFPGPTLKEVGQTRLKSKLKCLKLEEKKLNKTLEKLLSYVEKNKLEKNHEIKSEFVKGIFSLAKNELKQKITQAKLDGNLVKNYKPLTAEFKTYLKTMKFSALEVAKCKSFDIYTYMENLAEPIDKMTKTVFVKLIKK